MPKYVPQSLPMEADRKPREQTWPEERAGVARQVEATHGTESIRGTESTRGAESIRATETIRGAGPSQPAIQLGQYVRRERGMQGVRLYAAAVREFLPASDYHSLCEAMGVPPGEAAAPRQTMPQQAAPQQAANPMNQMQMLQMLTQLMSMQGGNPAAAAAGGMGAGFGSAGAGSAGAGSAGAGSAGINPMLLAQLMGAMQG